MMLRASVAAQIVDAEIVRKDEDDVGLGRLSRSRDECCNQQRADDQKQSHALIEKEETASDKQRWEEKDVP